MTIQDAIDEYKRTRGSSLDKMLQALLDAMIKAGIKFTVHADGKVTIENGGDFERRRERELNEAMDTLRLLHDYQNGCPLPSYEKWWNEAMRRSQQLFDYHKK